MSDVVASHVNSEGERITVEIAHGDGFEGRLLLVIHDDPPLAVKAPMLLDSGTADWLATVLADHQGEFDKAPESAESGER